MSRLGVVYALLAVGGALAFGFAYGGSWALDMEVIGLVGVVASVPFVKAPQIDPGETRKEPVPRSRIAHYAKVAKFRRGTAFLEAADNPFERRALSHQRWPALSERDLKALAAE